MNLSKAHSFLTMLFIITYAQTILITAAELGETVSLAAIPTEIFTEVYRHVLKIPDKKKYPWEIITELCELKQVCKQWLGLLTNNTIAQILDLPPMHVAAATGNIREMMRLKLDEKNSIFAPDGGRLKWVPADYAYNRDQLAILQLLQSAEALLDGHDIELSPQKYTLKKAKKILKKDDISKIAAIFAQDTLKKVAIIDALDESETYNSWSPIGRHYFSFISQGTLEKKLFYDVKHNNLDKFATHLALVPVHGADINTHNQRGHTLLHRTCSRPERFELLKLLLEEPSLDLNRATITKAQETPLHVAILKKNYKAIGALLADMRCNANKANAEGETPLHMAAAKNNISAIEEIFLYNYLQDQYFEVVKHHFVNLEDDHGCTPLRHAVTDDASAAVECLLDHGADSTIIDEWGNSLLHLAVHCKSYATVPVLLARCKKLLNEPNQYDVTPLINAVKDDRLPALPLLLQAGAYVNQQDRSGCTALHHAKDTATISYLYIYGANPNLRTFAYKKSHHWGYTPLHFAALNGRLDLVKKLIECGANIIEKACDGMDAQRIAYEYGNKHIVAYLQKVSGKRNRSNSTPERGSSF